VNYTLLSNKGNEAVEAMIQLQRYGIHDVNITDYAACRDLRDLLIQNYPCMREKMCTPFGDEKTFFIVLFFALLLSFIAGYVLRKKIVEAD